MWYSIGDKYQVIRHDNGRYERRFNAFIPAVLIIAGVFLVNSYTFTTWFENDGLMSGIRLAVNVLATVSSALVAILKYLKNNKEIDLLIVFLFIFTLFITSVL